MKQKEFERLGLIRQKTDRIYVNNLVNKKNRTLIYGYEPRRESFHLYLEDGEFRKVVYDYPEQILTKYCSYDVTPILCVPTKRIYPQWCDFEFCALLRSLGVHLPFTTPTWGGARKIFYGRTLAISGSELRPT